MSPETILIIDDNIELLENTAEVLEVNGYSPLTATNGKKGIELAIKKLPDLILCDIMMKDVDGYDVLNSVKNNSNTISIPFVFLTAKAEKTEISKGMSVGANAYLTKPYSVEALLKVINALLHKTQFELF